MTLKQGAIGIDYSMARPSLAVAKTTGASFVIRYSAGAASATSHPSHGLNAPKLITPGEFNAILAAGLDIIANDEWYEARVTEGATAGTYDGAAAMALWKSCGLAKGASIYCSWDAAPNQDQWANVDAYLRAFNTSLAGYYHVDCYAGTPYLKHAIAEKIIQYGWRPNAGSWSGDGMPYQPVNHGLAYVPFGQKATPAHIWQTGNYWFNNGADENVILKDGTGSHLEAKGAGPSPVVPPKPAPPAKPVLYIAWPTYMPAGHYFGLISGPTESHGGYYVGERLAVVQIQQRLQILGYAPKTPGWSDGIFEQPTANAVAAWQRAHMPGTQYYGQVWSDDWKVLFTW